MINQLVLALVNSVLGVGNGKARNNYAYVCPFHTSKTPGKKNFEVNLTENNKGNNPWNCWSCGAKGRTLVDLFYKVNAPHEKIEELKSLVKSSSNYTPQKTINKSVSLPKEFKSLENVKKTDIVGRHALKYLRKRKINKDDIIKYNIGYCTSGKYVNRVVIPIYNKDGGLIYFVSRTFIEEERFKYKIPNVSRDIIPNEHLINWNLPLILCEGIFDAIAIKRNAIPLLGKNIQDSLMKKIVTSEVTKIYIALDKDAIKQSLHFCEQLMNEGKEVYLVGLQEGDPSELGFEKFTNLIQKTFPLTYRNLMERKLNT